MLTFLCEGQRATVQQLPAAPKTAEEAKAQERVAVTAPDQRTKKDHVNEQRFAPTS
jgi:hypothetical protein